MVAETFAPIAPLSYALEFFLPETRVFRMHRRRVTISLRGRITQNTAGHDQTMFGPLS